MGADRETPERLELVLDTPGAGDPEPLLVLLAGRAVSLPESELRGAIRRAMLLLAAGGDPRREIEPDGRPATALAAELERPDRRRELTARLEELLEQADGLSRVQRALARLIEDSERAWLLLACVLIAEELEGADEEPP